MLTNTAAAILGMVALGAQSGYDIQRAAERSVRFFWALGPPQVYTELKRLENAGLLSGQDEAQGRRPRRLFEITEPGRRALHDWMTGGDIAKLELRDGELLRLFLADALDRDEALERVAAIRARSSGGSSSFGTRSRPPPNARGRRGSISPPTSPVSVVSCMS